MGERISHEVVIKAIHTGIKAHTNEPNAMTCEDHNLVCYLIDEGGFVIATNRDDARNQVKKTYM